MSCDSHNFWNPIPDYEVDKPLAPNNGVFLEALGISLTASPSFPDITTQNFAEEGYVILSVLQSLKTLMRIGDDHRGYLGPRRSRARGRDR